MDFLICEPQGRRGVIRPHGALVVLKRYVRFWYFPHWVYTWISLVWGPAYFSWLVYYTTDMQITASLAGREAWFHFFICPLNFFCAGILQLPLGGMQGAVEGVVCRTAGGGGGGGGRVLGAALGMVEGVVCGAVGWVLGVVAGVLGGVVGVPWGAGAGSRGGGAGRGGVGCRGGGCWEPRRGYWAWWWGCCGGGCWEPRRGGWWGQWGVPGEWCWELRRAKLSWYDHPPLLLIQTS